MILSHNKLPYCAIVSSRGKKHINKNKIWNKMEDAKVLSTIPYVTENISVIFIRKYNKIKLWKEADVWEMLWGF